MPPPLAASTPGTVSLRDYRRGTYSFAVETCTGDFGQQANLTLAPSSQTYLEV